MTIANGILDASALSDLGAARKQSASVLLPAYAPHLYNFKPSNTLKARQAFYRTDRPGRIACIGDSTVRGESSATLADKHLLSWPPMLAGILADKGLRVSADSWCCMGGVGVASLTTYDSRWTLGGTWTNSVSGAGGQALRAASAATAVFAPKNPVSKFVLWYDTSNAFGTFSYAVNGGSATNINAGGGANSMASVVIDVGSLGMHTLDLAWFSGGTISIRWVIAYDDTDVIKPATLCNFGFSGAPSASMIGGNVSTSPWGAGYALTTYFQADLSIIEGAVINDWRTSVALATSKANIETQITNALLSGDAWLMTPSFDSNTSQNSPIQDQYVAQIFELADQYDLPVIDWRSSITSHTAAGALIRDSVHQSPSGHIDNATLASKAF